MFAARVVAVVAGCVAGGGPALAGPLLIGPTTVQFSPGRRSAAIEVTNQSSEPADLQFRAFAWSQDDGHERLEPAGDLMVSPPITTVPAHARQVFRILDTGAGSGRLERSYRLKLNELPRASAPAVTINVEFSLPVFLTPQGAAMHLVATAGEGTVRVVNDGARRVRLSALTLRDPSGGEHELVEARSTYLLAGAARRFLLPPGVRVVAGTTISGMSDMGPIGVPLAILAAS